MATRTALLVPEQIKTARFGDMQTFKPQNPLSQSQQAQLDLLRKQEGLCWDQFSTVQELVEGNDDGSMGYKPITIANGPLLHYWFTYLGDTRCGGVVEGENDTANCTKFTVVLEDSDSTFYARNGTSDQLADRLNELQEIRDE